MSGRNGRRARRSAHAGRPDGRPQCEATSKTTGERCRRKADFGLSVCASHSGWKVPSIDVEAVRKP